MSTFVLIVASFGFQAGLALNRFHRLAKCERMLENVSAKGSGGKSLGNSWVRQCRGQGQLGTGTHSTSRGLILPSITLHRIKGGRFLTTGTLTVSWGVSGWAETMRWKDLRTPQHNQPRNTSNKQAEHMQARPLKPYKRAFHELLRKPTSAALSARASESHN